MDNKATSTKLFIKAIERIASGFRHPKSPAEEITQTTLNELMKKQAEHEERQRRISKTIASGARISRNL